MAFAYGGILSICIGRVGDFEELNTGEHPYRSHPHANTVLVPVCPTYLDPWKPCRIMT